MLFVMYSKTVSCKLKQYMYCCCGSTDGLPKKQSSSFVSRILDPGVEAVRYAMDYNVLMQLRIISQVL